MAILVTSHIVIFAFFSLLIWNFAALNKISTDDYTVRRREWQRQHGGYPVMVVVDQTGQYGGGMGGEAVIVANQGYAGGPYGQQQQVYYQDTRPQFVQQNSMYGQSKQ